MSETAIVDEKGLAGIAREDLILPRLKIVQPISQEGTPGKFRLNLTGQEWDELRVVPLRYQPGRVLWGDDLKSLDPICRSLDGEVPDAAIQKPVSTICTERRGQDRIAACPAAMWTGSTRPACAQTYGFIFLAVEDGFPFAMTLTRSSAQTARSILSVAQLCAATHALWDHELTLTLREIRGEKGKYFAPDARGFTKLAPGTHAALAASLASIASPLAHD
jgi:hypothetical protein